MRKTNLATDGSHAVLLVIISLTKVINWTGTGAGIAQAFVGKN